MAKVEKLLFPVDLSEASPKIVPWVKEMAIKFGAEIHLLFVARIFDHYLGLGLAYSYIHDFEGEIVKRAEESLDEFVTAHFQGLSTIIRVVRGYPGEAILEYAQTEGIDLIVIGTHGRKGLERIIFGSVAEHVVKNSSVPVLTVNPYKETWKDTRPCPEKSDID